MSDMTLANAIPQTYVQGQVNPNSRNELYMYAKRGLVRSERRGGTRFYDRDGLIALGFHFDVDEERDIPLDELLGRRETADILGVSHTTIWKWSDYNGGPLETVQFNNEAGRFWLRGSVCDYISKGK